MTKRPERDAHRKLSLKKEALLKYLAKRRWNKITPCQGNLLGTFPAPTNKSMHASSSNVVPRMRRRHLIRILIWPGVAHIKKIAAINIYEADIVHGRKREIGRAGASLPCQYVRESGDACTSCAFCLRCMFWYTGRGKTAAHHHCMLRGCRNNVSRGRWTTYGGNLMPPALQTDVNAD